MIQMFLEYCGLGYDVYFTSIVGKDAIRMTKRYSHKVGKCVNCQRVIDQDKLTGERPRSILGFMYLGHSKAGRNRTISKHTNIMNKLSKFTFRLILLISLFSCTEEEEVQPELDCYELARQLEREQFEAWQDFKTTTETQAIRTRYKEQYPQCRWD